MNRIIIGLVVVLLLVKCKLINENYPVRWLHHHHNFIYLTKIDFGVGESTARVSIRMVGSTTKPIAEPSIKIGIVMDESFQKFQQATTCEQRQAILTDHRELQGLNNQTPHITNFRIEQTVREHYWYFYLFSCTAAYDEQRNNFGLKFEVEIELLNNNSHFGEDQKVMWIYVVAFIVAMVLAPNNIYRLYKGWVSGERDWAHFVVCCGLLSLIIAYFYKLIHLSVYWLNGDGVHALDALSLAARTISQCAIVNLLLVIGWGWTITYLHSDNQDFYVPIGVMATLLHIIATVLGKITDDGEHKNHHFDCVTGWILLAVRLLILIGFVSGVSKTYEEARPKAKNFVRQFGLLGFLYLAGHPLAVVFCQILLPDYYQHRVVTAFVEITHALANGLLTYMITSKRSAYTSLDYSHRTVFTPVEGKVF